MIFRRESVLKSDNTSTSAGNRRDSQTVDIQIYIYAFNAFVFLIKTALLISRNTSVKYITREFIVYYLHRDIIQRQYFETP